MGRQRGLRNRVEERCPHKGQDRENAGVQKEKEKGEVGKGKKSKEKRVGFVKGKSHKRKCRHMNLGENNARVSRKGGKKEKKITSGGGTPQNGQRGGGGEKNVGEENGLKRGHW